jgi:hypothetical protein
MIPAPDFVVDSVCEYHGKTTLTVHFVSYDSTTHQVKYFLVCQKCLEEEGEYAMGWLCHMSACQWNVWTPIEDEPKPN